MALGLPVVVSDVRYCGKAGKLTHELNALILSSPIDVAELSAQLLRCLSVAAAQSPLSDGARELAQRFIWVRLATRQQQVYIDSQINRRWHIGAQEKGPLQGGPILRNHEDRAICRQGRTAKSDLQSSSIPRYLSERLELDVSSDVERAAE